MSDTPNGNALVAALLEGDDSAVAPFIARYWPLLTARVTWQERWRTRDEARALAWDVVADMALALLNARLAAPRDADAYMRRVMRNALFVTRRSGRDLPLEECGQVVSEGTYRAARGEPFDRDPEPEASPVRLPAFLRPSDIELMTLVGDGWTHREIAEELGIGQAAAAQRICRLKRHAQACIM